MAASGPGITDIKKLFARSGNRCAFPKCRASMVVNQTLIGEICHIKGEKPTSKRYDPSQTNRERHAYDNLVLMCPNHHTVIDDDDEAYTVERLRKIKASHEAQATPIAEASSRPFPADFDLFPTNGELRNPRSPVKNCVPHCGGNNSAIFRYLESDSEGRGAVTPSSSPRSRNEAKRTVFAA